MSTLKPRSITYCVGSPTRSFLTISEERRSEIQSQTLRASSRVIRPSPGDGTTHLGNHWSDYSLWRRQTDIQSTQVKVEEENEEDEEEEEEVDGEKEEEELNIQYLYLTNSDNITMSNSKFYNCSVLLITN